MTSNIPQGKVTNAVTNSQASCFDSEAFLRAVTEQSGVYRMYDNQQTVIYVGKAKDLKKTFNELFS
jgi:excinuclease ABC subunit C